MPKEDELGKEIGDFLDDKPIEDPPADPPVVDPPPVDPPVDPPVTDPPADPPPVVDPPVDPPADPPVDPPVDPPADPPPVDPPVDPPADPPAVAPVTEREKLLLARVEKLTGQTLAGVDEALALEPAKPADPPAVPAVPAVPADPPKDPEPIDFLGDQKLDDILDDPAKFNALLQDVYKKGVDSAQQAAVQKVLTSIPQLVTNYVGRHAKMSEMVGNFYKANQDLVDVKKTVAAVANDLASDNPDWTMDKVFNESATRTRTILGLVKKAGSDPPPVVDPPADPPKTPAEPGPAGPEPSPAFVEQGGRKGTPDAGLKGLQKDIVDLITD